MFTPLPADRRIERPGYAWIAIALEVFTAIGAIPVGFAMLTDTTGASVGLPGGWIEATPFGSYLVPGLYLLLMNGVASIQDRKSTRLNSSHVEDLVCRLLLEKKKKKTNIKQNQEQCNEH